MTDFDQWLDSGNEPDGYENIYSLYRTAQGESMGDYSATTNEEKGHVYIKGPQGQSLALVSEDAKNAFISLLRKRYMDGQDPEGWYYYMHSMSKED